MYSSRCLLRLRTCVTGSVVSLSLLAMCNMTQHQKSIGFCSQRESFARREFLHEITRAVTVNSFMVDHALQCNPAKRCLLVQLRKEMIHSYWIISRGASPALLTSARPWPPTLAALLCRSGSPGPARTCSFSYPATQEVCDQAKGYPAAELRAPRALLGLPCYLHQVKQYSVERAHTVRRKVEKQSRRPKSRSICHKSCGWFPELRKKSDKSFWLK